MNTFFNQNKFSSYIADFYSRLLKRGKKLPCGGMLGSAWFAMLLASTSVQGQVAVGVDLRDWTMESYPSSTNSNWSVRDNGQSVFQSVNAGPTLYYSDFAVSGADIGGTIRVNTNSDDDYIGFALGFNPGDSTNPDADYLLIDWKRDNQTSRFSDCIPSGLAAKGLALSRVVGIPNEDEFWAHTDYDATCSTINNGLIPIARGTTLGDTGWARFTDYRFRFDFSETALKVWVNDILQFDVVGEFSQGHIAFYNFSQSSVLYGGYTVNNVFANAGQDQSVLGGDVVMLDGSASGPGDVQYQWSQISGTPVTLTGENTARPTFTAPQVAGKTNLSFQLITSLGAESSEPDIIDIEIVDSALPVFLSRSVAYNASNNTVSGFVELNERGRIGVRVINPDTSTVIEQTVSNTTSAAPFSTDFAVPLPLDSTPPIIRVGIQAQDLIGNELPEFGMLIATDRTASNANDPVTGASIRLDGLITNLVTSNNDGNPVVEFVADQPLIAGDGVINFALNPQRAAALCGSANQCVVYVNGQAINTTVTNLSNGEVQFSAPLQEAAGGITVGETVRIELRIDRNVGSSGSSSAVDPITGNQFGATGGSAEIVQTILFNDGSAQIAAGEQGGDSTISFILPPEQDQVKCAGTEGVCVIQENNALDIPTQRTVLANGNVQYSAAVTFAPNEVKLYRLRVQDISPPQVGDISLSVPIAQGGQSVSFSVNAQDNTRIVTVACRYILPDGTVVEIVANQTSPGSGVWNWTFTPPDSAMSGEIIIEVIVTDLAGNTVVVQPIDAATGLPAKLIVDNDLPNISLPANPIVAPGLINGVPVAAPGQCVTLNIVASDTTTSIEDLNFIVVMPDGSEIVVPANANVELGQFGAEICINIDAIGGEYRVVVEAIDSAGNVIIVECDSFVVNTAPVVEAGNDIWVALNALAQLSGSFTDPDPLDTHSIQWLLGDGNLISDTLTPEYRYSSAGVYTATLTVTDTVGAIGSDTAQVYVTGDGTPGELCRKNFWKKQFIEKPPRGNGKNRDKDDKADEKEDNAEIKELFGTNTSDPNRRKCKARIKRVNVIAQQDLVTYITLIRAASSYFDEQMALTSLEDAAVILTAKGGPVRNRATRQTLAAWFNFAHGTVSFDDQVNIDEDPAPDMTFAEAMAQIEAILSNPNASKKELRKARKMALRINRS